MSYRSSPSFAVGGASWVDVDCERYDPACGYLCFHCGEHFRHWYQARRHFGDPGTNAVPRCVEMREALVTAKKVIMAHAPDMHEDRLTALANINRALVPGLRQARAKDEPLRVIRTDA